MKLLPTTTIRRATCILSSPLRIATGAAQRAVGAFVPLALGILGTCVLQGTTLGAEPTYAIVVSRPTSEDPEWKKVVEALRVKHRARILFHEGQVSEAEDSLRGLRPRYMCFVATPAEATRALVAEVHRLTCRLDEDPYTDTIWGILTGFDANNALRIARHDKPLTVERVAAGTEIALELCNEGVWYCELVQHRMVRKTAGGQPREEKAPGDTTKALVDTLNEYKAQLFVTSGHATERDWQIGYRYRNGQFRSENGQLFGVDTRGSRYPVNAPDPRVYLPVGNCLMGHIDGRDAMALAFMNSAGVHQMIGYTVPTWYGYAGWGMLDYFLEQPGRYTLAEAFFANQQALLHRLETYFPEVARSEAAPGSRSRADIEVGAAAGGAGLTANDARGLLFDRDVVAFYGDPAWEARMKTGRNAWSQTLTRRDGAYVLEIEPLLGERTFQTVNKNGSQRGGRPIVELLPERVGQVEIVEGEDLDPVITDDFILVPRPESCEPGKTYRIVFRAQNDSTRL